MAKNLTKYYDTSSSKTPEMGQLIDNMMTTDKSSRRNFERRWYDNNYFDDGHHFRYLSRLQNKIVDLSEKASLYSPMRAIPKASRQIRGVANLITSQDYMPVVYPEKVEKANFPGTPQIDPATGQQTMIYPEYDAALKESRTLAKRVGHWLAEEIKKQDLISKMALMTILAAKNYVSYLQITPDAEKEEIRTIVRDAFDVYLMGEVNEIEDSPHVIIAHPKVISEIKANEMFDKDQLEKINPDNRQASSEIKEAYMRGRYGREFNDDSSATLILKEAYLKEHLNPDNQKVISKQPDGGDILQGKKMGDMVYRQVFVAGNIWLSDKYVDLKGYPLVDFRFEPGPMYGVSLIERFIPTNKSLDMIVSRVERYAHTMTVGVWTKRQGEQFNLSNAAGGQIVEYKSVAPQQAQLAPLPAHVFNFIGLLNSFIEEQGVSTSTLGKIPTGVKAARAIESLKESEFANLVIPQRQFKKTTKKIAEKFLDYGDKYFVTTQTAYYMEKGEPTYFDIVGKTAMDKRAQLGVPVEGEVTPISGEYRVDIEVQAGLAYTKEGQKAAARELGDYIVQLAELGLVPPGVVSKVLESMLESYQFGPTAGVMEDMEEYQKQGQMTDPQMDKMKLAMAEVVRDAGLGEKDDEEDIRKTKVAVAEVAQDLQKGEQK